MANERVYSHRLTIATIAAMLLVAATVSMATRESADAYAYAINQAKSDVNECGNGDTPTNVGCQNSDSQIQGDNNSPSIASSQSVQRETPTGFTVTGSGTVSSETILCLLGPATPDPTLEVEFEAQSDGKASGTYTLSITDTSGERTIREGVITFGTTDGNTYTFGGEGLAFCGDFEGGISVLPMSISGDCGDGVTVHYGDLNTGEITFTGDVECTLT
ncbi:MAG TPA: hypothetical protein VFG77_06550 [Nitrososphaeraceae archaeon]|nr:hypothetical protein [Nitrososphaeraceae archaeon]